MSGDRKRPIYDGVASHAMQRKRERARKVDLVLRKLFARVNNCDPDQVTVDWEDGVRNDKPCVLVKSVSVTKKLPGVYTSDMAKALVGSPEDSEEYFHAFDEYEASMVEWTQRVAPVIEEGPLLNNSPRVLDAVDHIRAMGESVMDAFKGVAQKAEMTYKEFHELFAKLKRAETNPIDALTSEEWGRLLSSPHAQFQPDGTLNIEFRKNPTPPVGAGTAPSSGLSGVTPGALTPDFETTKEHLQDRMRNLIWERRIIEDITRPDPKKLITDIHD